MRLILIRHGDPDYKNDCLTELGKKQAAAVAQRLKDENIDVIYASTVGRATETATYTAELLNKKIIPLEFIREIDCDSVAGDENAPYRGSIDKITDSAVRDNVNVFVEHWQELECYKHTNAPKSYPQVSAGIDEFLEKLGFTHKDRYFLCTRENTDTVAVFCHGNSSRAAISRIFGIPFSVLCGCYQPRCTTVSVFEFESAPGKLILPKIGIINDSRHIDEL